MILPTTAGKNSQDPAGIVFTGGQVDAANDDSISGLRRFGAMWPPTISAPSHGLDLDARLEIELAPFHCYIDPPSYQRTGQDPRKVDMSGLVLWTSGVPDNRNNWL
jgi:hypothetical protein